MKNKLPSKTIETKQPYCPLCHQILEGETDPNYKEVYPEYATLRRQVLPITKKILMNLDLKEKIIYGEKFKILIGLK